MRVLLSSDHRYPAFPDVGAGRRIMARPSGAGHHIHDLIAKGLAELGHEVLYLLKEGVEETLPPGVSLVAKPPIDVDVLHCMTYRDGDLIESMEARKTPWVATCHLDLEARGMKRASAPDNWIFVSRALARSHDKERYVLNGLDPAATIYSETKDDYLLFMSNLDLAMGKGLDTALLVSRHSGCRLVVAGSASTRATLETVEDLCASAGAQYLGDVRGSRKAELFAGARALLFPTRINEAFGLVMVEALMSGTPVICSNHGACPEIVSPDVGFVCESMDDYLAAVEGVDRISATRCREKSVKEFHYLRMAADYVAEYEREIQRTSYGNGHLIQ